MANSSRIACVLLRGLTPGGLESFAEACFRFSPQIALRQNDAVFLEVGGSRALFSEESVVVRLKTLASRFAGHGFAVRVSIGDTAASALAAAREPEYARTRDLKVLPLECLHDFSGPFGQDEDSRKRILRMIDLMKSLGVKSVGEFAGLPRESLASRFGKEAIALQAYVWGDLEHAWPGFHPLPKIVESIETVDPEAHGLCADLEGCVFVLKGLVDRVMARLRGRGERASVVEIRFEPGARVWRVELPLPQGSTGGLIPILQERLAFELRCKPLASAVEAARVEVLESVPGATAQRDFFSKKEEEGEAWVELVGRLSAKLGKEKVFVASPQPRHLPEEAYRRGLKFEPVQVCFPDRPARILKFPESIKKEGRVLKSMESGKQWRVLNWNGPERLSGEWWKDPEFDGFDRDYYRVVTESGEQLWIYANRQCGEAALFLHGYFD